MWPPAPADSVVSGFSFYSKGIVTMDDNNDDEYGEDLAWWETPTGVIVIGGLVCLFWVILGWSLGG